MLPNAAMPNTFLAQAYDLADPWNTDPWCYNAGCCANQKTTSAAKCAAETETLSGGPELCAAYCAELAATPAVMVSYGDLHSRLKRPVGERLARAAYRSVYGGEGAISGPVISGCAVEGAGPAQELHLWFDGSLLPGERIVLAPYANGARGVTLQVLTNASAFCLQPMQRCPAGESASSCPWKQREWYCPAPLGWDFTPAALKGQTLPGFTPLTGSMLAYARQPLWRGSARWIDDGGHFYAGTGQVSGCTSGTKPGSA